MHAYLAADQQDNQPPSFVQQIKVNVILQYELCVANKIWETGNHDQCLVIIVNGEPSRSVLR